MALWASLLVGIVSGICVLVILQIAERLWGLAILPWFENLVYRDMKIDGNWGTLFRSDCKEFRETATVHQRAHKVSGLIQLEGETIKHYRFEGQIRNLMLTAEYWLKDGSSVDRGAFCLAVKENGRTLKGCLAWYSSERDEIKHTDYEWTKK